MIDDYSDVRNKLDKLLLEDTDKTSNQSPFDRPMPNQSNKQGSQNPFGEPKVKTARKLELYRMEPILIPAYDGQNLDIENPSSPQEQIVQQFKDMELECHYCKESIKMNDEKVMIGQNFYHTDHVQCNKCGAVLDPDKILELGDDIFCEVCFESECDLGKNRCGYCNEEIFGVNYQFFNIMLIYFFIHFHS